MDMQSVYEAKILPTVACVWCLDGLVQLFGGLSSKQGLLMVRHGGRWGTVCNDLFDYIDAGVVCRSLGFGLVLMSSLWHEIVQPKQFPATHTVLDNACRGTSVLSLLVHGQVIIIFVVSVCLSVCLFVCAEFFSAVFDPISIKLGHMLLLYVWV